MLMNRIDRKTYALIMVVLLLGSIGLGFVLGLDRVAKGVNVAILVVMALLTGARLVDAGYPRRIGIAGVFGLAIGLPCIATLTALAVVGMRAADMVVPIGLACGVFVLLFFIWAGLRPGQRDPNDRLDEARMNGRFATAPNARVDRIVNKRAATFGRR